MKELRIRFGRLVAAHRKGCGMTQDALAAASGMSVDMISRLEAGATGARFNTIAKLAAALKVDPAELFTPDLPAGALQRSALTELMARLASLPDRQLAWIHGIVEAVLKPHS